MKKLSLTILVFSLGLIFISCNSSKEIIPTSKSLPSTDDNYSIVWVGKGEAYSYTDGSYQRSSSNDYSFEVVQRRYGNNWKSVKNMHRIHPDYDGKAGPREQTMFFAIDFREQNGQIQSIIHSSLGKGMGSSDRECRQQRFQLAMEGISSFAPYNTLRINQDYRYEEGILLETVELFLEKNGEEVPFVKIEEQASIFRPVKLPEAPTLFN